MKVHLRVTNLETGKVNAIVMDAASESEALAKYQGAPNLHAEVFTPEVETRIKVLGIQLTGPNDRNNLIALGIVLLFPVGLIFLALVGTMIDGGPLSREATIVILSVVIFLAFVMPVVLVIYYLRRIANK